MSYVSIIDMWSFDVVFPALEKSICYAHTLFIAAYFKSDIAEKVHYKGYQPWRNYEDSYCSGCCRNFQKQAICELFSFFRKTVKVLRYDIIRNIAGFPEKCRNIDSSWKPTRKENRKHQNWHWTCLWYILKFILFIYLRHCFHYLGAGFFAYKQLQIVRFQYSRSCITAEPWRSERHKIERLFDRCRTYIGKWYESICTDKDSISVDKFLFGKINNGKMPAHKTENKDRSENCNINPCTAQPAIDPVFVNTHILNRSQYRKNKKPYVFQWIFKYTQRMFMVHYFSSPTVLHENRRISCASLCFRKRSLSCPP